MAQELEKTVNSLLEESAVLCVKKDYANALDKAKEAEKKEKGLVRFREEKNIAGEQNYDLTYSVLFNLARCYHSNGLYTEALETYQNIVKNKNYTHSGRLRVNMGNIYFEQRNYRMAIKMYRIALDQIMPAHHKELRSKISKNIGVAFIKLGQYNEAISNFEEIVNNNNNDIDSGTNFLRINLINFQRLIFYCAIMAWVTKKT
jgi:intraflagellar transport protein 88